MSNSTNLWGALICVSLFASACSKDVTLEPQFNEQSLRVKGAGQSAPVAKQFKMTAKTWYRISPAAAAAVPGIEGQQAFANMPGAGSGTASNMGNVGTWFNQLAFSPDGQNPIAGTVGAPLAEASTYTGRMTAGAPLPAVQPEDLRPLNTLINWLQVPSDVNGNVVWSVVYNGKADALFLSSTSPSLTVKESSTRVTFTGEGVFVGGRGIYANASGTYTVTGYFNPEDANDAELSINGEVIY